MLKIVKYLSLGVLFFTGCIMTTKAQQSIPGKQLFDYSWKFFLGDSPSANAVGFDDTSWRKLDLPHDWSIEGMAQSDNDESI